MRSCSLHGFPRRRKEGGWGEEGREEGREEGEGGAGEGGGGGEDNCSDNEASLILLSIYPTCLLQYLHIYNSYPWLLDPDPVGSGATECTT